jgi:GDP-D-mannose 3', 5'-epimerase
LIAERLGWKPSQPLSSGLALTYEWIEREVLASSVSVARRDIAAE